jgi:hypothetical protein
MKAKILSIFAAACLLTSTACDDFLKEELVSDISSASHYTTPQGFEDAVSATYSWLKTFYGVESGASLTVFGTDIHTNGADGSHKFYNSYNGELNPAANFVRATWTDFYRGINQANAAINRSQSISGIDEAQLTTRLAEVRFLRALYYFNLVQIYGDVHFTLEETEGVELVANKTPQATIYAEGIIPDLENAIANLPASQSDYGRATKGAAQFLLAKVHMTRAYKPWSPDANADAAKARDLMTAVIESGQYGLLDDYDALWEMDNQLNKEVIFASQNTADPVTNGDEGNRLHLFFLMEYDVIAGMVRDVENGRPWKRFRPTPFLLSLWDREHDSRYDKSYKHVWYANQTNTSKYPKWTQADADNGYIDADMVGKPKFEKGDTAIYIPGPGKNDMWTAERQKKTRYHVYTDNEYTELIYPTLKKFLDPGRPDRQWAAGSRDFVIMRLADAYLIRAEAKLFLGNAEGAAEDLNVVRERAAWEGEEAAMEISASDVTLDFILDERARELAGELTRWFDLTRTGKLVERVNLYNVEASGNIQPYHTVRPIPQNQIDRTEGGYEQNCGYPGGPSCP